MNTIHLPHTLKVLVVIYALQHYILFVNLISFSTKNILFPSPVSANESNGAGFSPLMPSSPFTICHSTTTRIPLARFLTISVMASMVKCRSRHLLSVSTSNFFLDPRRLRRVGLSKLSTRVSVLKLFLLDRQ
ncbi:LOW QUALITY PROTEIN: hypothetical protein YC2023_041254 [Brassica napus]